MSRSFREFFALRIPKRTRDEHKRLQLERSRSPLISYADVIDPYAAIRSVQLGF